MPRPSIIHQKAYLELLRLVAQAENIGKPATISEAANKLNTNEAALYKRLEKTTKGNKGEYEWFEKVDHTLDGEKLPGNPKSIIVYWSGLAETYQEYMNAQTYYSLKQLTPLLSILLKNHVIATKEADLESITELFGSFHEAILLAEKELILKEKPAISAIKDNWNQFKRIIAISSSYEHIKSLNRGVWKGLNAMSQQEIEPDNIELTKLHKSIQDKPEIFESVLTPLENYILRYIIHINKPFSIGKIHNSLVLKIYHFWHIEALHKQGLNHIEGYKKYGKLLQKLNANIFPNNIYELTKEEGQVILLDKKKDEALLAQKSEDMTYNSMKDVLSHPKVKISIPSYNRIKRALENFTDWEIITTRKSKGNKASKLYVMTFAFQTGFKESLNKYFESDNSRSMESIVIDILNEEAS